MIEIEDISHVAYFHDDLSVMEAFLVDFGLKTVIRTEEALFMRGRGHQPYAHLTIKSDRKGIAHIAFQVATMQDLEQATLLPGASGIEVIDGPENGLQVRLVDPDGFAIHLVYWYRAQSASAPGPESEGAAHRTNSYAVKNRLGQTHRPQNGPADIYRLGHVLLHVRDLSKTDAWYRQNLGLRLSDGLTDKDGQRLVAGFYRLSKGTAYVDHHSIGFVETPEEIAGTAHHASFEVDSFDAISAGHHWLASKGWKPRWGIGRHVLGSQIFDYWHDPAGNIIEHYADGDLFNEETAPQYFVNSVEMLASWAPPHPGAAKAT